MTRAGPAYAIVGRGCVLPGGLHPDRFIEAIVEGRDLVSEVPDDRWGLSRDRSVVGSDGDTSDRAYHRLGGYVTGFEEAYRRTELPHPEAVQAGADPTRRWLAYAGQQALTEAGVRDRSSVGSVVGQLSFPSEGMARYAASVWTQGASAATRQALRAEGVDPKERFWSARPVAAMSAALGLGRRGFTLDAACASALYAIDAACARLDSGECDVVLAGAVNRADDLFIHVGFTALKALSLSGRSRPFHPEADGLLPAEGCVLFAIRRLSDAVRRGDRIFGVVRGIGLANDGRAGGVLAPSAEGQTRAIRRAWERSGLDPAVLGLLECHATGTVVGDRTELQSTAAALGDVRDLAIGSIKSNLGHPVTAAGGAALLKVLGAMAHGVRPPTLHLDGVSTSARELGFRVVSRAEPWEGERVAAVSAFGFGGNDAHLVVTEDRSDAGPIAPPVREPLVVVSGGVRSGAFDDFASLVKASLNDEVRLRGGEARLDSVEVGLENLRFPPSDLDHALGQQLAVMEAVREAIGRLPDALDASRTGVVIGMEADPTVCRYGLRWRLAEVLPPDRLESGRDAVIPRLTSAGVVGTMPNIPANRCSVRFDLCGPGYVVSSEGRSGLDAWAQAARHLHAGDADVMVVGAVDLSCEEVHAQATRALGDERPLGDHAVALILTTASHAAARGWPVWAEIDGVADGEADVGVPLVDGGERWGVAHAAEGMMNLAAAVGQVGWGSSDPAVPRRLRVCASGPEGVDLTCEIRREGASLAPLSPWQEPGPTRRWPAHRPPVSVTALEPEPSMSDAVFVLPEPPVLAPILPPVHPEPVASPSAPVPPVSPRGEPPSVVGAPAPRPPIMSPPAATGPAGAIAASLAHVTAAHQRFLAQQHHLQQRFLAMRGEALSALTGGPGTVPQERPPAPQPPPTAAPRPVVDPKPPAPSSAPPLAAPVATPRTATTVETRSPAPPVARAAASPRPAASPAPASGPWDGSRVAPPPAGVVVQAPPDRAPVVAQDLPGPKIDREGLLVHASGEISRIFGPSFADQDGYARQCRMPEPPLLLADRVIGIDAPDHVLGTGTLWSETDVGSQAWYLHQGRIPAGVMIEAGQADLMLISWMGIDRFCASERVYRLLGCTLTYHAPLPRVGDTIQYDIHVDGHAKDGDIRLFFFHYDCVDQQGQPRLSVRGGQAGFFTDQELADSDGVIWKPETAEYDPFARLDPPAVRCTRTSFEAEHLHAFAAGDGSSCFGPGFEWLKTHNDTPRIAGGQMLFLHRITDCVSDGGPWGRGYLRGEWDVSPDDWFFQGHFKNDPCMPGTLMFEGCLQALSFYLASLGFTLRRDGWRFEPVPGNPIPMICRGQVLPGNHKLVYEVFVEEVHDGPYPTVYADLLCTIDGLKAFHARRCGLRLAPAWPLDHLRASLLGDDFEDARPPAVVEGFPFGYDSMLACAWGRPSEAFGPMYKPFDGPRCVPRLPGPPYHFLTRLMEAEGPIGGMKVGTRVKVDYDIPPDAWYFDANGAEVMPFCVLLEAALQPCGWLASYVGSALTTDQELFFRNLDGTATQHEEIVRHSGTMTTEVEITSISRSGGMIIQSFDVVCRIKGRVVYDMKTVFGFFPAAALAEQKGLPFSPELRDEVMAEPPTPHVDLTARPAGPFGGTLRLPAGDLCMLDRIKRFDPTGGEAGLGRVITAKDVDHAEWFFKAHFFQDPVQPGSLGLEAMMQALQWWMIETGQGEGLIDPRFEGIAVSEEHTWTYRGQVTPARERICVDLEVLEVRREEGAVVALAQASLWCDGLRIYGAKRFGMRVVEGAPSGARRPVDPRVLHLDPAMSPWVADHAPTWTVPALPMMSLVDHAIGALRYEMPDRVVAGARDVQVRGWVVVDRPITLTAEIRGEGDEREVTLLASAEGEPARPVLTGTWLLADALPPAPPAPPVVVGQDGGDPYESGSLFHGPAFRYLTRLTMGEGASSAWLDASRGSVPPGALGQGLLDATLHGIPHDAMHRWEPSVAESMACYPHRLVSLSLHTLSLPFSGRPRVNAQRLEGRKGVPRVEVTVVGEDGSVLLSYVLEEVAVPKGPLGAADPSARRRFLRDREPVDGVSMASVEEGDRTVVREADVRASGWLPGTLEHVYGLASGEDVVDGIARREHGARLLGEHPGALLRDGAVVRSPRLPLNPVSTRCRKADGQRTCSGSVSLDLSEIEAWWRAWFGMAAWPLEDLDYALIERFVRRVGLVDPDAFARLRGRPALFLANHQTAVESLLFSVLAGALTEVPCVTIAKDEHRTTWLGRFIRHGFSYPGVRDPRVISFFDRTNKESLKDLVADIAREMAAGERSGMVHVEGTRALHARHPTVKMSSLFIDMALSVGAPIVPVRFVGGLPVEPLSARTEFPVGLGRQDIWFGTPLWPEDLEALPYKERKQAVLAGIEAAGPPLSEEVALPGDPALARAVARRVAETGVEEEHAVIAEVLLASPRREASATAAIVDAIEGRPWSLPDGTLDEEGAWVREMIRRLAGDGALGRER